MPFVPPVANCFKIRKYGKGGVSKFVNFDTPPCFYPDGEGAVRMVPDGRSLRVRVTGVDFGQ